jgi:hypothetical protein
MNRNWLLFSFVVVASGCASLVGIDGTYREESPEGPAGVGGVGGGGGASGGEAGRPPTAGSGGGGGGGMGGGLPLPGSLVANFPANAVLDAFNRDDGPASYWMGDAYEWSFGAGNTVTSALKPAVLVFPMLGSVTHEVQLGLRTSDEEKEFELEMRRAAVAPPGQLTAPDAVLIRFSAGFGAVTPILRVGGQEKFCDAFTSANLYPDGVFAVRVSPDLKVRASINGNDLGTRDLKACNPDAPSPRLGRFAMVRPKDDLLRPDGQSGLVLTSVAAGVVSSLAETIPAFLPFVPSQGAVGQPLSPWKGYGYENFRVEQDLLEPATSDDPSLQAYMYYYKPFGKAQEAYVTVTKPARAGRMALMLRSQCLCDAQKLYAFYDFGSKKISLVAGGDPQGGTSSHLLGEVAQPIAEGQRFGARVTSAGRFEVIVDKRLAAVADVSNEPAFNADPGDIGMLFERGAQGITVDDFGGGDLPP